MINEKCPTCKGEADPRLETNISHKCGHCGRRWPKATDAGGGNQSVYVLWEGGHLEMLTADRDFAQRWTDSNEWRGFTTEAIDSSLKRGAADLKIQRGK